MTTLKVLPHDTLCPAGATLEVPEGMSICDALLDNHIEIEHACEKSCACTTCHVIVRAGHASLDPPTDKEDDLLDKAWGLELTSRLSCQARLKGDAVTIEIPRYTINHASELKR
ncbi:MAG TPA: ISC system 2Fe-2S type ferredoxin [Usitatibacter sp.]|nr:ISC system 2Fe-2S type ferredoxin [Usitatibacter sp.]